MDKNWQVIGERMPYFGVISAENLKPGAMDQEAVDEFFATGERHVGGVLDWVRRYFGKELAGGRCLDLGCGVGRLALPFAKHFTEVVGVDISKGMLDEAKRNSEKLGLTNTEFVLSDDNLSRVTGKFDLIHSFIVLQHIDPKRGEKLFRRMLAMLSEDGVGVLHFTYAKENETAATRTVKALRENVPFVNGIINLVKGRDFGYPHIPMHNYDLNRLVQILYENGVRRVMTGLTNHGEALGIVLMFQNNADPNPPDFP